MLHFIPDEFKRLRIFQLWLFLNLIIQGAIISPLMLLTYIIFYKYNKKMYKLIINRLCYLMWIQFTYLVQWWNQLRIRLYVNEDTWKKVGNEHALVIMNHKYDIDWLATWIIFEKTGLLGGSTSVAKQSLRYIPLMGWAGVFNGSLYLHRDWTRDKDIIAQGLEEFSDTFPGFYNYLIMYPEGTRFTQQKMEASNEVARAKGMPELRHCMVPRSRGFVEVVRHLRGQIDALYDLTIGFPDSVCPTVNEVDSYQPPFTLNNVLKGKIRDGNFYLRRIPIKELPEDDAKLSEWLQENFRLKDKTFDEFVHSGRFPGPSFMINPSPTSKIIYCCLFLLIWVPLLKWTMCLILFGSWITKLLLVLLVASFSIIIHFMKNMTKTEKGSAYGAKKTK